MIGLGINIYESGQDYTYLIDAIQSYGLAPHIRLGLTIQSRGMSIDLHVGRIFRPLPQTLCHSRRLPVQKILFSHLIVVLNFACFHWSNTRSYSVVELNLCRNAIHCRYRSGFKRLALLPFTKIRMRKSGYF